MTKKGAWAIITLSTKGGFCMTIVEKIVHLQQSESNVYALIQTFLESKRIDSANTAKAYLSDIETFFRMMLNKSLNELTIEDLNFKYHEIEAYRLELAKHYSGSTVNRKIASVKSLFEFFAANDIDTVNPKVFSVKRMKHQTKSYGVLSPDEGFQMVELAKRLRNGKVKSVLIHLAIRTSFRLRAILSLTWDDITYENGKWIITAIDKGNVEHRRQLIDHLYNDLIAIKPDGAKETDLIFNLSTNTCDRMIKQLASMMGISEKRNITFHSLRKIAPNYALEVENDLPMAVKQGGWSNPQTFLNSYMKKHEDLSSLPGVQMGAQIDISVFKEMSKEQLVDIISATSINTQHTLLKIAKEKGIL